MAKKSGAHALVLTHVDDKHETEKEMLQESRDYPETSVAHDGYEVNL